MTKCGHCGSSLNALPLDPRFTDDPIRDLEEIEQEILCVQLVQDELIQKRCSFKQEINRRYCPALQLPPEISTEIFSHCLPSVFSSTPSVQDPTPFHLGHICRTWRDAVWATPRLWSTMCLDVAHQCNLSLIIDWLNLSGQYPISVRIYWGQLLRDDESFDTRNRVFTHVLDVVANYSERLQHIDILVPAEYSYDSGDLSGFSRPLPLLKTVSLHNFRISPFEFFPVFSAPRLEEIRLWRCELSTERSSDSSMLQVKHVLLRSIVFDECLAFLNHVSPIRCTIIDIMLLASISLASSIQMPCLESLTIESKWGVTDFLDHLTAPAMLQLIIVSPSPSILPLSKCVSFLRRSSCPLQSLSLSGPGVCGAHLFECLQLLPSLVKLELASSSLREEIVQLLGPFPTPAHSQCLLPNLEVLGYAGQLDFNSLSISGILLFRWRQGVCGRVAQLRRVVLRTMLEVSETPAVSQYQHLISEGLELSIGTANERWL